MNLIGKVVQMDVDPADGKVSGAFLRARVAIEIDKPVRRGVLLRMSKNEEPRCSGSKLNLRNFLITASHVVSWGIQKLSVSIQ